MYRISKSPLNVTKPSPYDLWLRYLTKDLQDKISPESLSSMLSQYGALELIYLHNPKKENVKCNIINQTKLNALIASLRA